MTTRDEHWAYGVTKHRANRARLQVGTSSFQSIGKISTQVLGVFQPNRDAEDAIASEGAIACQVRGVQAERGLLQFGGRQVKDQAALVPKRDRIVEHR
jgi:hypothetical protein